MSTDQQRLTPLTSTPDEAQAALIVAALEEHGIDAVAQGGYTAGFRAETIGEVQVMVWREQLDEARRALAAYRESVSDIDWDQVDVGEME